MAAIEEVTAKIEQLAGLVAQLNAENARLRASQGVPEGAVAAISQKLDPIIAAAQGAA